jgi:hypothetical protein
VTATEYGTITETDLTAASFAVTLACNAGYASAGTPTAVKCTSAGDYTVTDPCTGTSPDACLEPPRSYESVPATVTVWAFANLIGRC